MLAVSLFVFVLWGKDWFTYFLTVHIFKFLIFTLLKVKVHILWNLIVLEFFLYLAPFKRYKKHSVF